MEEQDLLTPQEFAAQVKAKYPQYKDIEDSVLVEKMVAKYPQYKDKINFDTVEVPKGEAAEVDGESVSTSASTTSSSDSTPEVKQDALHPFAQSMFPELYDEYRQLEKEVEGKPIMYMGHEIARMEEIKDIMFSQPTKKSMKRIADEEIAALNKKQDELVSMYMNRDLGGRTLDEVLASDGVYEMIIKDKKRWEDTKAVDEAVLSEIVKDTNSDQHDFLGKVGRVFGFNAGASQEADETLNLDSKIQEQILLNVGDDRRLREQIGKGYLPLAEKENIINEAKADVLKAEFNRLKAKAQTLAADTTIEDVEKINRSQEIQEEYNQLLLAYGVDEATGLLKNNFQKTRESEEFNEMTGGGGFLNDSGDAISTFLEGVVQTGFKGTVGFTADVMSGFGDEVSMSDDDEYSVYDAFSDTVNALGNYNYLPSSQKVETRIVDPNTGELNLNLKTATKSIAQVLPFTLAIINDAKKGKITNAEKMFGQLLNPTKSKSVSQTLSLVDSAYRHTLSDNLAQAEELGLTGTDGRIFANTLSLAEGMAETIMPDTRFFKTTVGNNLLNTFKGNLKNAASRKAKAQAVQNFVKNMALELGEEEVVLATEDALKYAMVVGHENSEFFDMKRQKELAATTMLLSGVLGGANVKRDYQGNLKDVYVKVAQNINETTEALQDEYDNGLHNEEIRAEIKNTIDWANNMNLAISKAPQNVTGEQIDLLMEKQRVVNEMKNVDDAFKPQYQARIEELNNQINPQLKDEETTANDGSGQTKNENQEGAEDATPETVQTESKEEDVTVKYKKAADQVRQAKFYKNPSDAYKNLQSDPTGLLKFAWDGAMETIATSIEATGNLNAAINKGIKTLKQSEWYQSLSPEGKKKAVEMFEKDTRSAFTPMAEATVKPKKETTKATIRKTTGQTDTSKKITMSESKLFKHQMATLAKGAKEGFKAGSQDMIAAKKEVIKAINESVKPLIKKYKDNTLYAKAYNRAMSAINQYDGKNFAKVVDSIMAIEEMIEKEALSKSLRSNRRKAKSAVKKLGKTADPIRRLLRYKPEWLSEEEIKELNEVLGMFSTKWTDDYDRAKVEALEEKLKANYLDNIGERIESTKEDTDNFSELDDIAGKMNKMRLAGNRADLTTSERTVVRDFSQIVPEYFDGLTQAKLREINKALTALVEDGILVNEVLFDHVARNDAKVAANELKGKLGTETIKTKNNFLDSTKQIFKDRKNETIEEVVAKVRKRMLQHVDTVITNFKGNYLYTNIIHPFSSNLEIASNQTSTTSVALDKLVAKAKKSREGSRISRLGQEIKRGAKLDGSLATSYEFRLQAMLQFYFREKEFRANPEFKNSKVFSIADHMKNLNANPQQTNMTEASVKEVNSIYDKFKDSEGNIDLEKLENNFTKEEKALIDFMENKIQESEEKARFTADHVRGESQTFLNNYFPRKSSKVDTRDQGDVLSMKDSGGGLSVKASAANARAAKKGEALDFSTLNTFLSHVGAVNIDYYMSPQLKKMRLMASEMGTGTAEQAKLGQVLLKITNDMVKAQVSNVNDPINSKNEKFFNILKRKTFNKVLIDPIKLIGWDIPSTWIPIGLANAYRMGRVKTANKNIDKTLRKKIMKEIGSVQVERIGNRSADIKATSSSTITKAKFKTANPSRRDNLMDFVNKNKISDLADLVSTQYYKTVDMMMGNLWSTSMFEEFKNLTGKELNSGNYEALKDQFPKEMKQAVAKADKETSNLFNTATTAEQKLDVQFASSTSWKKIVDTFMKSFAFNENSVMWDSLKSMVGKGNMTREEAIRTFAIVNARGLSYAYLSQIIMGYVLNPAVDDEDEFDEISQKAMERSLWQHGMLYAFGNRGNVFNMAAAYLIESGREVAFKSEGEKYNQYEDANLFALPKRGTMSQYVGALGAEGELIKVSLEGTELGLKILTKYAEGEEITKEDLIEWKAAGYSLSLLSQLTGLSTYRLGKFLDKELKANQ